MVPLPISAITPIEPGQGTAPLGDLVNKNVEWLIDRFREYAIAHEYAKYTSTLREAWRMTAEGINASIVSAIEAHPGIPELTPDADYSRDPVAAFGKVEAVKHRKRGIKLEMFLGLLKYFRQSYRDLVQQMAWPEAQHEHSLRWLDRFFDRLELGFIGEWTSLHERHKLAELQSTNRTITNEKNKYLTVVESLFDPVILVDADGRLDNLNHAAATLFLGEDTPGSFYYNKRGVVIAFPWLSRLYNSFMESDAQVGPFQVDLDTTRGRRRFDGRFTRMLDVSEKFAGTVVTLNDVTEREDARAQLEAARDELELNVAKRTAELLQANARLKEEVAERQRAEDQLLQAQKLEAIGTLAGGVAHDLNNLLLIIQGNTELVGMLETEEAAHTHLAHIHHATGRAAGLVRQLLLFSRKQPMQFNPLDLNALVQNLARMLRRLIGEEYRLETHLCPEPCHLDGDAGSVEQVVMNLVLNARDAMPSGGTITLTTTIVTTDENSREKNEVLPEQMVELRVEDHGMGMEAATMARIFEPFFTTKEVGRGTGLGLSVVHGIVKRHDGWLEVSSEPAKGSIFQVYLPRLLNVRAHAAANDARDRGQHGKGERLLVVEDEEGVRHFLHCALLNAGYTVEPAASAEQAECIFRDADFHAVICDVVLPGRSGPELLARLRRIRPELPAVLLSGYTAGRVGEEGMRDPLLPKPFALADLLATVQRVLHPAQAV